MRGVFCWKGMRYPLIICKMYLDAPIIFQWSWKIALATNERESTFASLNASVFWGRRRSLTSASILFLRPLSWTRLTSMKRIIWLATSVTRVVPLRRLQLCAPCVGGGLQHVACVLWTHGPIEVPCKGTGCCVCPCEGQLFTLICPACEVETLEVEFFFFRGQKHLRTPAEFSIVDEKDSSLNKL